MLSRQRLRRVLRQAQAEGRVSVAPLADALSRAPRHRGARAIRAVIADGPTLTRSAAEDILLDLIAAVGLPAPEVNPPLTIDGKALMPDLLWRDRRLVVEVDGERFHASAIARRDDARRQALLKAHGHRVLRVDYDQLARRPAQTIARIAAALTTAAGMPRRRPSSRRRPRPASSDRAARGGSGA